MVQASKSRLFLLWLPNGRLPNSCLPHTASTQRTVAHLFDSYRSPRSLNYAGLQAVDSVAFVVLCSDVRVGLDSYWAVAKPHIFAGQRRAAPDDR